jgi:hypothetical protein
MKKMQQDHAMNYNHNSVQLRRPVLKALFDHQGKSVRVSQFKVKYPGCNLSELLRE